jgi:hypothetical protein
MEAQMAKGKTALQGQLARRNTGGTQLHFVNISLQFERAPVSPLGNI